MDKFTQRESIYWFFKSVLVFIEFFLKNISTYLRQKGKIAPDKNKFLGDKKMKDLKSRLGLGEFAQNLCALVIFGDTAVANLRR